MVGLRSWRAGSRTLVQLGSYHVGYLFDVSVSGLVGVLEGLWVMEGFGAVLVLFWLVAVAGGLGLAVGPKVATGVCLGGRGGGRLSSWVERALTLGKAMTIMPASSTLQLVTTFGGRMAHS